MNLGVGRLVIILALVASGVVVLSRGFDSAGPGAVQPSPGTSGSPNPSSSVSPSASVTPASTPEPNTTGVTFMALNGTSVTGAGAAVQNLLQDDGYAPVLDAADSPVTNVPTTIVYFRAGAQGDQNEADAQYINAHYFNGQAEVLKLDLSVFGDVAPRSASIVVVVGDDIASDLVK